MPAMARVVISPGLSEARTQAKQKARDRVERDHASGRITGEDLWRHDAAFAFTREAARIDRSRIISLR